jgi:moderate conductance mechanosensitive channel
MLWISRLLATILLVTAGLLSLASAQETGGAGAADPASESVETPLSPRDAARALIGILDDEVARSRLIGELGRIAAEVGPAPPEAMGPPLPQEPPAESTVARELGLYTQSTVNEILEVWQRVSRRLGNLATLWNGTGRIDWSAFGALLWPLVLVAGVAYGALFLVRRLLRRPMEMLAHASSGRGLLFRIGLIGVAAALEMLALGAAWAASVATVAALAAAAGGRVGLVESLFTNAFVFIEAAKIALAVILMPRRPELRLPPLAHGTAHYWTTWLSRLTGFLGYGMLLAVPIVNAVASFQLGLGVRLIIVLGALVWFVVLVARNAGRVRAGLTATAAVTASGTVSAVLTLIAPIWHVALIAYALVAFLVWITRPFDAVGFMLTATLQSAAFIVVGAGLMTLISRAAVHGARLPAGMSGLRNRIDPALPTLLAIFRIVTGVLIVLGVLHAWSLADPLGWAASPRGSMMLGRFAGATVILVGALVVWIAATTWIEFRLRPRTGRVSTPRARTLLSLFRNALSIVVVVIGSMLALSELGVDIAPLIAGAGVLGLAIGFGSQKLVQDIITGAFIQFENAMNEGDVVTAAGVSGVVEKLTIRSVGLRDLHGVYHIIPFSSVDSVSNFVRGFGFHVADLRVSVREDASEVKRLMGVAFERLMQTDHQASVLEPLEMQGIADFVDTAMILRARIKTLPGKQWGVGRAYNELLKTVFDEHGILIPAPPSSVLLHGDYRSPDQAGPGSDRGPRGNVRRRGEEPKP